MILYIYNYTHVFVHTNTCCIAYTYPCPWKPVRLRSENGSLRSGLQRPTMEALAFMTAGLVSRRLEPSLVPVLWAMLRLRPSWLIIPCWGKSRSIAKLSWFITPIILWFMVLTTIVAGVFNQLSLGVPTLYQANPARSNQYIGDHSPWTQNPSTMKGQGVLHLLMWMWARIVLTFSA